MWLNGELVIQGHKFNPDVYGQYGECCPDHTSSIVIHSAKGSV